MTNDANAKFGYVITSTPGLIEDGSFILSADGIRSGEVEAASPYPADEEKIAIYPNRETAEKVMNSLVPDGKTPECFAGLGVQPAYPIAVERIVNGLADPVGFELPSLI